MVWEFTTVLAASTDAPGAWVKGTRVKKVNSEYGDGHTNGDLGIIYGSIGPLPEDIKAKYKIKADYMYFVIWDDFPEAPVAVGSNKLEKT